MAIDDLDESLNGFSDFIRFRPDQRAQIHGVDWLYIRSVGCLLFGESHVHGIWHSYGNLIMANSNKLRDIFWFLIYWSIMFILGKTWKHTRFTRYVVELQIVSNSQIYSPNSEKTELSWNPCKNLQTHQVCLRIWILGDPWRNPAPLRMVETCQEPKKRETV